MKTRRLPDWPVLFAAAAALLVWHQAGAGGGDPFARPAVTGLNQGQPVFLAADDAFRFDAWQAGDQLKLAWQIADGYYLYQHRFQIKPQPPGTDALAPFDFPAGVAMHDDYFGPITAYYGQLELSVALQPFTDSESNEILVVFQGCADAGLCYPPQKRIVQLDKDGHTSVRKTTPGVTTNPGFGEKIR